MEVRASAFQRMIRATARQVVRSRSVVSCSTRPLIQFVMPRMPTAHRQGTWSPIQPWRVKAKEDKAEAAKKGRERKRQEQRHRQQCPRRPRSVNSVQMAKREPTEGGLHNRPRHLLPLEEPLNGILPASYTSLRGRLRTLLCRSSPHVKSRLRAGCTCRRTTSPKHVTSAGCDPHSCRRTVVPTPWQA